MPSSEVESRSSPPVVSRVRDIARRFESSSGPTKRLGKFRLPEGKFRTNEYGQMYRISQPVRVGIVRKKSSLKKRSSSEPGVPRREQQMKKSHTSHDVPSEVSADSLARPRGEKPKPPAKPPRLLQQQKQMESSQQPPAKSVRPRVPPPAPPLPPSKERLARIPSYRQQRRSPPKVPRQDSDEIYEKLPSPEVEMIITRAEPVRVSEDLPRVPTIPPPPRPIDQNQEDEVYEEIYYSDKSEIKLRESEPQPSTSTSPSDYGSSSSGTYVTNIYCGEKSCPPSCLCSSCSTRRRFSAIHQEPATPDRSFHLGTLARPKKASRRPVSGIEIEKLMKFKSELQLNFSKKVIPFWEKDEKIQLGQLRQKVGDRRSRLETNVKCRIDANGLDTDRNGIYNDDDYIYGDDWSSDEEDNDRRSSMYKELEEQLNKAFPTAMSTGERDGLVEFPLLESEYESADLFTSEPTTRPDHLPMNRLSLSESKDESSPDYDYSRQYTSRLTAGQPLYQIYMLEEQEKLVDVSDQINHNQIEEKDKVILSLCEHRFQSRRESSVSSDSGRGADCSTASALTSNTSMRRERLIAGSHFGSQRSLWCELPEVKAAGLLDSLDEETKLLQEAYFEVITSEASYLRSLNILITHFMASVEMLGSKSTLSVINNVERKHLFSNIFAVRDCSERLLCDLESRLEENLVLDDVCDILQQHFNQYFDVYVKYCSNQVYQDRTLRRLKAENSAFLAAVSRLEADKQCQGLDMRSFLMLPMQRITRYPLLLYAILDRLSTDSSRYETASKALAAANTVVRECNEGARRMERTEQLLELERRIVYKDPDLKRIPLVSNSRYLVKRGTLLHVVEKGKQGILQPRQRARSLHVFLFSDILMITKKKVNGTYVCKDYCARRFVDVEPVESDNPRVPQNSLSHQTRPHLFSCVLMRDARGRQTELLLSAESETDRERWLSVLRPPTSANPEEKLYAAWDCPTVLAVHSYSKNQDDEMDLQIGDLINILRKMPDGWLFGERVRDGISGWFPSSYVQQILNDHVRANNYRHRLRLIQAATGTSTLGRPATSIVDRMIPERMRRASNPRTYLGL